MHTQHIRHVNHTGIGSRDDTEASTNIWYIRSARLFRERCICILDASSAHLLIIPAVCVYANVAECDTKREGKGNTYFGTTANS